MEAPTLGPCTLKQVAVEATHREERVQKQLSHFFIPLSRPYVSARSSEPIWSSQCIFGFASKQFHRLYGPNDAGTFVRCRCYSMVTRPMTTARTSACVRFVTSSFWKIAAKWFLVVFGLM